MKAGAVMSHNFKLRILHTNLDLNFSDLLTREKSCGKPDSCPIKTMGREGLPIDHVVQLADAES